MRRRGGREEAAAGRGGVALCHCAPVRKLMPPQRKEAGRGGGFVVKAATPGFERKAEVGGGLDGELAAVDKGAAHAAVRAK